MIITTFNELEIGKIYTEKEIGAPLDFAGEIINKYSFLVIRRTDEKEYRRYVNDNYPPKIAKQIMSLSEFYEIHAD